MRTLIVGFLVALMVAACSLHSVALRPSAMTATQGSLPPTDAYCSKLHNTEIALTAVAAVVAALSGSTGISAAVVDPDKQRLALGITSIISAAITAGTGAWLVLVQRDFSQYCQLVADPVIPSPTVALPPYVDKNASAPPPDGD